ncbi:hypothetical protein GJAV_G00020960 [Gymnothorax javanicus]|nr:hypothetical protein GJAV_G00020960 [Gymnothorax javanicus]
MGVDWLRLGFSGQVPHGNYKSGGSILRSQSCSQLTPGLVLSMNNLNEPPGRDFRSGWRGDGDGSRWNYAFLVPLLGLAAFRWIWSRECQREIGEVKAVCERDLRAASSSLELNYREALTESRQAAARVELQLEKERQRVQGYRQAYLSQSQQLLEERKVLEEEREALEGERREAWERGIASVLLKDSLERESERQADGMAMLGELETRLVERQSAFCSVFLPRKWRREMEKDLLTWAANEPLATELNMEDDLKDIFVNDRHCDVTSWDKRRNGSLMWLYLRYWQLQVTLLTHKRAQDALQGPKPNQN